MDKSILFVSKQPKVKTAEIEKIQKKADTEIAQLGFLIISNYCTFLFYRCTKLFISENLDGGNYR